jgi:chemotaxis protein CheD
MGPQTFVHTGEVAVSGRDAVFSTILGSCVSICVWDARTGAGGMNHFLLPDQPGGGVASPRFGNIATATLLSGLERLGSPAAVLQAKIFGGASVMDTNVPPHSALGARNVELARVLLNLAGIRVDAEDVGGTQGRKLVFRTGDGAAWVRKL